MREALFSLDGNVFVPHEDAHGPWMHGTLHGGPVCGLVAHVAEALRPQGGFVPARLVVDMHRPVPMAPIRTVARVERASRRMALVAVELHGTAVGASEEKEVTRASVLFVRGGEAPVHAPAGRPIESLGPHDGAETTAIVPPEVGERFPPGFHRQAEVRWLRGPGTEAPAAWMRMPMPLVRRRGDHALRTRRHAVRPRQRRRERDAPPRRARTRALHQPRHDALPRTRTRGRVARPRARDALRVGRCRHQRGRDARTRTGRSRACSRAASSTHLVRRGARSYSS